MTNESVCGKKNRRKISLTLKPKRRKNIYDKKTSMQVEKWKRLKRGNVIFYWTRNEHGRLTQENSCFVNCATKYKFLSNYFILFYQNFSTLYKSFPFLLIFSFKLELTVRGEKVSHYEPIM